MLRACCLRTAKLSHVSCEHRTPLLHVHRGHATHAIESAQPGMCLLCVCRLQ
jgi:hypothetical protein